MAAWGCHGSARDTLPNSFGVLRLVGIQGHRRRNFLALGRQAPSGPCWTFTGLEHLEARSGLGWSAAAGNTSPSHRSIDLGVHSATNRARLSPFLQS